MPKNEKKNVASLSAKARATRAEKMKSIMGTLVALFCAAIPAIHESSMFNSELRNSYYEISRQSKLAPSEFVGSTMGAFIAIIVVSIVISSIIARSKKGKNGKKASILSVYPITTLIVAVVMTFASISGS